MSIFVCIGLTVMCVFYVFGVYSVLGLTIGFSVLGLTILGSLLCVCLYVSSYDLSKYFVTLFNEVK